LTDGGGFLSLGERLLGTTVPSADGDLLFVLILLLRASNYFADKYDQTQVILHPRDVS
jgi:hypothetical protein